VYYDVQISNYVSSSTPPTILRFTETRVTPFLINPQDYTLSIIRFQIDTSSLPIFAPEIAVNQPDPNFTIYSITLEYHGHVCQQFMEFVPQDISIDIPPSPNPLADNSTGYYNIFSYQYVIGLVNNTFTQVFNALTTAVGAMNMPTPNAPFLSWDTTNNIAIINADLAGFASGEDPIGIYFNNAMFNLFSSFMAIYEGFNVIQGMNKHILISNNQAGSNTIQLPIDANPSTPTYTAIQMSQEYSTIALWNPISSIIFTSNTLPIVPSNLGNPLLFYDSSLNIGTSSGANYAQIITDMVAVDTYKPSLVFEPYFPREIDLIGNGELRTIDINCFYKSKLGVLQPFILNSGCSASLKLMFSRIGT